MDRARYDAIVRRPDEEGARESFPTGFPDPIDVPAARYTDPAFLALEREHVFEKCWLFVAHAGELPEVGVKGVTRFDLAFESQPGLRAR